MATLLSLILFMGILLATCPCLAKQAKRVEPKPPLFVETVTKIAQGRTFQDRNAKNVSFTLTPSKAGFSIRF